MLTNQQMAQFRIEMVRLSQQYPFIKKVLITDEAWTAMCSSFDRTLHRSEGETEKHIDDCAGSMCFQELYVERIEE